MCAALGAHGLQGATAAGSSLGRKGRRGSLDGAMNSGLVDAAGLEGNSFVDQRLV